MARFSHCACANVILLGRVAKRCQHHPTTSNNTQHFSPKSNFAQHHPTIPNITQQCPTWVAKRSQHLYPTLLAFVGQKCWHRLARALKLFVVKTPKSEISTIHSNKLYITGNLRIKHLMNRCQGIPDYTNFIILGSLNSSHK